MDVAVYYVQMIYEITSHGVICLGGGGAGILGEHLPPPWIKLCMWWVTSIVIKKYLCITLCVYMCINCAYVRSTG